MSAIVVGVIAVVGGFAVTLQGQFMGIMDQTLGTKESVFITYAGGGVAVVLLMLILPGNNLRGWTELPWYVFTSGLLGLVIVGSLGFIFPRMGAAPALITVLAFQLLLAALIDHFGWFGAVPRPITLTKIAGMVILFLGVWLVSR